MRTWVLLVLGLGLAGTRATATPDWVDEDWDFQPRPHHATSVAIKKDEARFYPNEGFRDSDEDDDDFHDFFADGKKNETGSRAYKPSPRFRYHREYHNCGF